jgi:CHAT domain-containing protein/tetratricopeptide (TPR) repeat protein
MKKLICIALCLLAQSMQAQTIDTLQQQFDSLYKLPNRLKETIALGQQILSNASKTTTSDSILYGKNALRLGVCFYNIGQYDSAEILFQTAYSFCAQNSDDQLTALHALGTLRVLYSDFSTGDSLLTVALEKRRKYFGPNQPSTIRILYGLGSSKENQDKYLEAENLFVEGMAALEQQNMQALPLYARFSAGLGLVLTNNGQNRRAEKLLFTAIKTAKNQPNQAPDHIVYSSLIHVLNNQGKYAEALDYSQQIHDLMKELGMDNNQWYLAIIQLRAQTFAYLGLHRDAIKDYETCLKLGRTLNLEQTSNFFQYIYGLAGCLRENGEAAKAIDLLEPWRDSIQIFGWDQTLAKVLWFDAMAKCFIELKRSNEAIAYYKQAINLTNVLFQSEHNTYHIDLLISLAQAYLSNNEPQKAISYLQTSEAAKLDPMNDRYAMGLLARSYAMNKQPDLAAQAFDDWLSEEKQSCITELFCITEQQRQDRIEKLIFSNNAALTFLKQQSAAIPFNFLPQVVDFQIFKKSLLLSSAQKIRENIQADTMLAPTFAGYIDTRERLAWAYTQPKASLEAQKFSITVHEARADSLEQSLARRSTAFASANLRQPFSWTDVRKQLRPGEAAIEIARFYELQSEPTDTAHYAIFIIRHETQESPSAIFLPEGNQFDQIIIEKYLTECASPTGKGQTNDLYEAFWAKLEPYLKGISRVYVSADGAFLKINLGAIKLPDGQYVADRYDVRNVLSLKDVGVEKDPAKAQYASKTAYLVGNPTFLLKTEGDVAGITLRSISETPDSITKIDPFESLLRNTDEIRGLNLSPLPGSEQEVKEIAALLRKKGWKTTVETGLTAKEDAVKTQQSPTVLHLATHGYFLSNVRSGTAGLSRSVLENNPMLRSMIFFAGAQNALNKRPLDKEDGILTAYEAQNLHLEGTEIVVLSACQTAQGKIQNGEGVYGLQRALLIAGAKSVLLSLWDVDDKVGRAFMTIFYEKWLGGMSKQEAFRAAQLEIKKKYPLPFYWAGFILIGA